MFNYRHYKQCNGKTEWKWAVPQLMKIRTKCFTLSNGAGSLASERGSLFRRNEMQQQVEK
jgi:hypothetical protein